MTRFSRRSDASGSDVDGIAADLRRQSEDLKRLRRAAGSSSSETASILEKLEDLRRRSEALGNVDPDDQPGDRGLPPKQGY
ncbi:MAG TPA: hypothetical protein VF883_03980 [Thermoanaerobaculia bacterium]|jgi:hypothetical protein